MEVLVMPISEIASAIAITVGMLTVCGIIGKFLWEIINLKVSSKYRDYMTREQLKVLIAEVLKEQDVVTSQSLARFCEQAQRGCPRNSDYSSLSTTLKQFSETMETVVQEQKVLRQQTLPKEYPSMGYFKETVERIEKTMSESSTRVEATVSQIHKRLDNLCAVKGAV
jgi:hypothetical protein